MAKLQARQTRELLRMIAAKEGFICLNESRVYRTEMERRLGIMSTPYASAGAKVDMLVVRAGRDLETLGRLYYAKRGIEKGAYETPLIVVLAGRREASPEEQALVSRAGFMTAPTEYDLALRAVAEVFGTQGLTDTRHMTSNRVVRDASEPKLDPGFGWVPHAHRRAWFHYEKLAIMLLEADYNPERQVNGKPANRANDAEIYEAFRYHLIPKELNSTIYFVSGGIWQLPEQKLMEQLFPRCQIIGSGPRKWDENRYWSRIRMPSGERMTELYEAMEQYYRLIISGGGSLIMTELSVKERSMLIWQKYRKLKGMSNVIRSGYGLYHIYDLPSDATVRPESVQEHTMSVLTLVMLVRWLYPEHASLSNNQVYLRMLELAALHEVGEIEIGDVPDDGTRDEKWKDAAEYQAFTEFVADFPEELDNLNYGFWLFQQRRYGVGADLYCLDKLEAILRALVYEAEGHSGDLKDHDHPSERDLRNAERAGSTKMADIFAIGLLDKMEILQECTRWYGSTMSVVLNTMKAAFLDVRGEIPAWLNAWRHEEPDWFAD